MTSQHSFPRAVHHIHRIEAHSKILLLTKNSTTKTCIRIFEYSPEDEISKTMLECSHKETLDITRKNFTCNKKQTFANHSADGCLHSLIAVLCWRSLWYKLPPLNSTLPIFWVLTIGV